MAERRVRSLTGIVAPGPWSDLISVQSVKEALGPDPNAPVTLILHSPGGDAREGLAIYGAIRRHQGDVRIEIDGEAASAASLIAFAGDSLYMAAGAQIMMHEPSLRVHFHDGRQARTAAVGEPAGIHHQELRCHLRRLPLPCSQKPRRAR